jgi:eukaryotic-like serine/threonine-protein kinase
VPGSETIVSAPSTNAPTGARPPAALHSLHDAPTAVPLSAPRTAVRSGESGPLQIGEAFGPRYHIIKMLGIGGMGAVYQAWDAELGVAVAIKVIRPEVMADPIAAAEIEKRFKRELLLARQVTHKNVVRIHDLGEINGIKYITMPYVDGDDLATILKRDGRLTVPRALRIARAVVVGLVEAHKAGVVHRDLKPANIMISGDDEAMIMDFGIARSTGAPTAGRMPGAETIARGLNRAMAAPDGTVLGAVIGTVGYMAPEQAKGIAVDQRADLYALGLILYDMLTGQPRTAKGANPIVELQARMEHAPPPVKSLVPKVPDDVDRLVSRCLEPDVAKRYQTTEELAADLARLDDEGIPIPEPRRFTPRMIAASVLLVALLVTGTWWFTRTPPPPKQHDPVSVVIADFRNGTSDPTFDNTLGQTVRRALEDASFISAYDRSRIPALGVRPPTTLDELGARELAVKQGLGVVLAGSVEPKGNGFEISVRATQTITGDVIANVKATASNKDKVLETASELVARIRKALGDETSQSAQLFAMRTLSTSSLKVVGLYASGMEAQSQARVEDARQFLLQAVQEDPKFGLGYQGLAILARNTDRPEEADKYIKEALRHLDGMTEREQFSTRGTYFQMIGDNQQCAKEYGELVKRYAADPIARNQRAICLAKLRNMRDAVNEMRQAVQILPNYVALRNNLALFTNFAGDFETAESDIKAIEQPNNRTILALAYSQMGRGLLPEATETYQKLGTMGAAGASSAAQGLGDLAVYEGRFSDAVRILEAGAAADVAAKNGLKAAIKFTTVGYAHLLHGRKAAAIAAADKSLQNNSSSMAVRFLAARIFAEAGAVDKAKMLADQLTSDLSAEPQAHGKIIEGLIAMNTGKPRDAIKILSEANGILDTWFGHFDLGRAYLAAGAFPQADAEFDRSLVRRGEALSLMDEGPTYGYFPPVYYYRGRVREELKTGAFADSYREYLKIRGKSTEDPLLPDIRKRVSQ